MVGPRLAHQYLLQQEGFQAPVKVLYTLLKGVQQKAKGSGVMNIEQYQKKWRVEAKNPTEWTVAKGCLIVSSHGLASWHSS